MKILIIDTCGATGSIALADTDLLPAVVGKASLPGRTASERLVCAIKDLTAGTNVGLQTLEVVVVVHGPGSFTGVRVGLSAAKGLCDALGLPLVAVSRLAVLAHLAQATLGVRVCALFDAGRGEFYFGEYVDGICLREALLTRDELSTVMRMPASGAMHLVKPPVVVTCEVSVEQAIAEFAPRIVAEPTAEDALPLALRRIEAEEFDNLVTIDANYLRRTDAEIFAKPRATAVSGPARAEPETAR
jgi:tRNA threonylcarbamoyladenosine biosynthesis protein TsaB